MHSETEEKVSKTLSIAGIDPRLLLGQNHSHLRLIEKSFNPVIIARGEKIVIEGKADEVDQVVNLFKDLMVRLKQGDYITEQYLNYAIEMVKDGRDGPAEVMAQLAGVGALKRVAKPKTIGQKQYLEAIAENDIVFSIGPAGTGKTYLAVAVAVAALNE